MNKMMGGKKPAGMNKTPKGERTMPEVEGKMGRMKGKSMKAAKAPAIGMSSGGMAMKSCKPKAK